MISESIKESRKAALASEAELWEYLIEHGEVEDFNEWVLNHRKQQEAE